MTLVLRMDCTKRRAALVPGDVCAATPKKAVLRTAGGRMTFFLSWLQTLAVCSTHPSDSEQLRTAKDQVKNSDTWNPLNIHPSSQPIWQQLSQMQEGWKVHAQPLKRALRGNLLISSAMWKDSNVNLKSEVFWSCFQTLWQFLKQVAIFKVPMAFRVTCGRVFSQQLVS